jgi:hypothetical protein
MNKHAFNPLIATVRLLVGIAALAAIVTQLSTSISNGWSIVNFFSFFTIESNILATLLYIAMGIYGLVAKKPRPISTIRGAITLYMTLTGIVYALLLSGNEIALQTTIGWVNLMLHYVFPIIILLDWLLLPPKNYVPLKRVALWLIFPALYLIYSLIRGSFTNWYPYPFINPIVNGWPTVVVMSIFIAIGTIVLGILLSLRTRQFRPKVSM